MLKINKNSIISIVIASIIIVLLLAGCRKPAADDPADVGIQGYTYAAYEGARESGDSFLVCGTKGRLDRIYEDGTVENIPLPAAGGKDLTHVLIGPRATLVGGLSGVLLCSGDGKEFIKCDGAKDYDIAGLAYFNGKYFACAANGLILVSEDGFSWSAGADLAQRARGPLLALAATGQYIMAITAETDIFISEDGVNWDLENFNQTYESYYQRYVFTSLSGQEGISFFILGHVEGDPGDPIGMYTQSGGEVWEFAVFSLINNKSNEEYMPITLNSACVFADQLITACDRGRVFTIASCIKCSSLSEVASSDLKAIALSDNGWILAAGDDFEFAVVHGSWMIQDRILQGTAISDIEHYGAVIIDVRPENDYDEKHIPGSLNIPSDEIESRLPAQFPNAGAELIFYCSNGVMAQKALYQAQQLGYQNVSNLGGLSDWTFDAE